MILARPNTTVTMLGRNDTPAGLLANDQFARLAAKHADAELASMLGIGPGDGRFKMFLKDRINFDAPKRMLGREGADAYEAYPGREGRPDEFVGDVYVISAGRTAQTPPVVSDMILQNTREGGGRRVSRRFRRRWSVHWIHRDPQTQGRRNPRAEDHGCGVSLRACRGGSES